MQSPDDAARIADPQPDQIAALARLYDGFANAIDPFSPQSDDCERIFMQNVAVWHDSLPDPKPGIHEKAPGRNQPARRHLTRKLISKIQVFDLPP